MAWHRWGNNLLFEVMIRWIYMVSEGFIFPAYSSTITNGFILTKQIAPQEVSQRIYHQTSNISRTLVGNEIVDHSDVVGASPVGAAQTTSSFSTEHLASMDWAKMTARRDEKHLSFGIWWAYIGYLTVIVFGHWYILHIGVNSVLFNTFWTRLC